MKESVSKKASLLLFNYHSKNYKIEELLHVIKSIDEMSIFVRCWEIVIDQAKNIELFLF